MGTSKQEAIEIGQALAAFNAEADEARTGVSVDSNTDPIPLDRDIDMQGHSILNVPVIGGPTGPAGPAGADGSQILTGSPTPSDADGADGDFYVRTANGDYYQKSGGTWGAAIGNLTGATGATGPTGAQGPAGATGADGADGIDGATFLSGVGVPSAGTGSDGDYYLNTSNGDIYTKSGGSWGSAIMNITGPAGAAGPQGATGPAGADGLDGADGAQGPQGIQGVPGNDGADGATILNGSGAPAGALGAVGDYYLDTATDDFYEKTGASAWTLRVNLKGSTGATGAAGADGADGAQGPQGIQGPAGANGTNGLDGADGADGADGKTILNGTVDPTTEGVNGDFYIRTDTNEIFGPKAAGSWPAGVSLVGPTGATGAQGPQGDPGADGADGADANIADAYPVGSIYMNASVATNPATLLGFGTWVALGEGRVLVGKASSGTFDTAGAEVGAETVDASHTHGVADAYGKYSLDGSSTYTKRKTVSSWADGNKETTSWGGASGGSHTSGMELGGATESGGDSALSVIQPSLVVYMWKRTA